MIIWIDKEKAFDKIQHPFMIKKTLIKVIYDKPKTNTTHNGEKLEVFPLRSGRRQGNFHFYSRLVLEILVTVIRRKRKKINPYLKGRSKIVTVCRWHDAIHRKS